MAKGAYIGVPASNAIGDLACGSIVKLTIASTPTEFMVVHQGNPDASMYDASCDGTWLLAKDLYENRAWSSSNNNYELSDIHAYLNDTFFKMIHPDIRSFIKDVKIPYRKGNGSGGTDTSGSNGLPAKIFLLSGYELGWTTSNNTYLPVDGACLDYFKGLPWTDPKRIGYYNGTAADWWTRSPVTNGQVAVWRVGVSGNGDNNTCTYSYGIRPALVMPSNLSVDSNGNVTSEEPAWKDVARKIKKAYIGVDGKARKIKKAYIGVNGVAKLCWAGADPVFANNTWAEVIAACQAKSVPAEWKVGDSKTMTIGGQNYQIDIIGKNHDTYSDGSGTAPLTFQLHDVYSAKYGMNSSATNAGGWTDCEMRTTTLPAILATMPSEVEAGIKEVNKKSTKGNRAGTLLTTADKLFLLANMEIFGEAGYASKGEGTQYAYYAAGNSTLKNQNGSASTWWQRSPNVANNNMFCVVNLGGLGAAASAGASHGVSFAFCF